MPGLRAAARKAAVAALWLSLGSLASQPAAASAVQREVTRIAQGLDGVVGVAAWTLDAPDDAVLSNADRAFPMASTFKVAVAATVLSQVDAGAIALDTMLPVPVSAYVPSEPIAAQFPHPGVSLSVRNLLEVMLVRSDNTATDVLVDAAGGPGAVTAWLTAQGIAGQRVDRNTADLVRDFFSLGQGPVAEAFERALAEDPALASRTYAPAPAFDRDPRDTSTPLAMARLLHRLFSGQALSAASTELLIDTMSRCRTCDARLRGRLPAGTFVADKTGTIGGSVNSVGAIALPDGRRMVIAVFVAQSAAPVAERESAIAEIARTVRDHFLLRRDPAP